MAEVIGLVPKLKRHGRCAEGSGLRLNADFGGHEALGRLHLTGDFATAQMPDSFSAVVQCGGESPGGGALPWHPSGEGAAIFGNVEEWATCQGGWHS